MNTSHYLVKLKKTVACVFFLFGVLPAMQAQSSVSMKWSELPPIPDQHSVNGAFVGVSDGALLVAGGANFPEKPVWEGGQKHWHDQIYVLKPGSSAWSVEADNVLPKKLAYGVSIDTPEGIVCIGGNNQEGVSREVFRLKWNSDSEKVIVEQLPALPIPLYAMGGDRIGDQLFLVGGQSVNGGPSTSHFLSLDLSQVDRGAQWEQLGPFPGQSRIMPVVVAQHNGKGERLFVFSGTHYNPNLDRPYQFLSDVYAYNPLAQEWKELQGVPANGTAGAAGGFVGAAPVIQHGNAHILILGGAGGPQQHLSGRMDIWQQKDTLTTLLSDPALSDEERDIVRHKLDSLDAQDKQLVKQTAFTSEVMAYHTITDTWVSMGEYTDRAQVVTRAVRWQDQIVIPAGETSPGVRTSKVLAGTFHTKETDFGWVNYATLCGYLLVIVAIGLFFSKKNNSTNDFFLGGNRIPWWAAGISIYATMLSAITYLSQPALAFAFDWQVYLGYFTILLIAPLVTRYYIPYFRRLNITTAYEYLENRFDIRLRLFGSISFVLFQLARMGVVVYLPALALSTVMGMDIFLAIIIMGILSILYTVMGGIEAVIWTDVLQVGVLIFGLVIGVVYISNHVDGGVSEVSRIAMADQKMRMVDWRFSWTEVVTWSLFLGAFALNIAPYTADQTVVQRYMSTRDEQASVKSMWISAWMVIPAGVLTFSMGTFLYAYYKLNPELLVIGMETDRVFPLFIANQLPAGFAGLVIAGIFSASMSSLDSSMHSVSTVVTIDFYKRFSLNTTEEGSFSVARRTTVLVGVIGTCVACVMALYPVQSLFFLFQEIIGLAGSALAGIFILGIFFPRTNGHGALVGAVVSIVLLAYLKYFTPINFYIYPLIGIPACVAVAVGVSSFTKKA